MSDSLRQSTTDKVGDTLKPDSEKSYLEKAGDSAKSAADSVGATLQPESEKSGTQKLSDDASNRGETGEGILGQAQAALGNAAQTISDTLGLSGGSGTSGSSTSCMQNSKVDAVSPIHTDDNTEKTSPSGSRRPKPSTTALLALSKLSTRFVSMEGD